MCRILFSAIVLLLFTSVAAQAAKTAPGDACANLNYYTTSGGSETGGIIYFLICDGSHWQTAGIYSHASHNAGLGYGVLYNSGGTYDTAVGDSAMLSNTSGADNTALGYYTLNGTTTGSYNTALGDEALYQNVSGGSNTAVGYAALAHVSTGSSNTAIGYFVGPTLNTGSNNILIGTVTAVDTPLSSTSNFLNIGNTIFATGTNTGTVAAPAGNVGIGTTSPSAALHVIGDIKYTGLLSDVSDRRLKDNIAPLGPQLGRITSLEPVSFKMKADPEHRTMLGLIAQDVEPIYPDLVTTAPDGTKSMAYTSLIAPMIEATKEQQAEINQLRAMLTIVLCAALWPSFLLWRNRR